MGALSGTLTATVYYVQGDLPDDFKERYIDALGKNCFADVDLALEQDESMGWVNIADPFDTDFDLNKILWGSYLMVSLRHDAVRLPAAAFKFHLAKAIKEYLAETGKERISKAEKEEVKDHLDKQLKKRVLPAIKTFDMVWNLDRGQVWFFTTNKKMNELFVDLFEDTFGLAVHERNPYTEIERLELDDGLMEQVLRVEPAAFAAPPR